MFEGAFFFVRRFPTEGAPLTGETNCLTSMQPHLRDTILVVVQCRIPDKKKGKLAKAGFLILRMGAFYTNFSITTPEVLILLSVSACLSYIARFLSIIGVLSSPVPYTLRCIWYIYRDCFSGWTLIFVPSKSGFGPSFLQPFDAGVLLAREIIVEWKPYYGTGGGGVYSLS